MKTIEDVEEFREGYWDRMETDDPTIREYRQRAFNYIVSYCVLKETLREEYTNLPRVENSFFKFGDVGGNLAEHLDTIAFFMGEPEENATPEEFEETVDLMERYMTLIANHPDFKKAELGKAPKYFPEFNDYWKKSRTEESDLDFYKAYIEYAEERLT